MSSHAPAIAITLLLQCACTPETVEYGSTGSCTVLFEKLRDCDASFGTEQETFVTRCNQTRADIGELMACVLEYRCQKFIACATAARESMDPKRQELRLWLLSTRVRRARTERRWKDVMRLCKRLMQDVNPSAAGRELCDDVPAQAVTSLTLALTALRDDPSAGGADMGDCDALRYNAHRVSRTAEALAENLCREVELSHLGHAVIAEARERIEAKRGEIPLGCEPAIRQIATMSSNYTDALRGDVIAACYVDLGRVILGAGAGCGPQVRRLIDGIERYKVADKVVLGLLANVRPSCGRASP